MSSPARGFHQLARLSLLYTVSVVLFGAWVRISGSGDGCGESWPTCHGELLHMPAAKSTWIELTHRVTSSLALFLAIALCVRSIQVFPRGHSGRTAGVLSLVFMITEALLGAGLVLLRLVGVDDSPSRAVMMAAHLVNTLLLTGVMTVVVWSSGPGFNIVERGEGAHLRKLSILAILAVIFVSMSGAITALGDTVYPLEQGLPLMERLFGATNRSVHFLVRLRAIHPFVAVLAGFGLVYFTGHVREFFSEAKQPLGTLRPLTIAINSLVGGQMVAGFANIWLSAPGWLQVVHLLLAQALWIALVAFTAEVFHRTVVNRQKAA